MLSIVLAVFQFSDSFSQIHSVSDYREVEAQRAHSIAMNAKESIILSTSYWMRASAALYDSLPAHEKTPQGRELAIKEGILAGWAFLSAHDFSEDFEVELWCGRITPSTKEDLSVRMLAAHQAQLCDGCSPLSSQECMEYIQLSQGGQGNMDSVLLKAAGFGVVGASVYSPKYEVATVAYIPPSLVVR